MNENIQRTIKLEGKLTNRPINTTVFDQNGVRIDWVSAVLDCGKDKIKTALGQTEEITLGWEISVSRQQDEEGFTLLSSLEQGDRVKYAGYIRPKRVTELNKTKDRTNRKIYYVLETISLQRI